MQLDPNTFAQQPLANLLSVLTAADPRDVPLTIGAEILPHRPGLRPAGATASLQSPLHDTLAEDTRIPVDHPEIDVPGVTLESFLGGGGQGWVYAGRVRATNKIVAVKALPRATDSRGWGAREAILCSRIRHPNVLRILRAVPAGAFWIIIMELVQGDDLAHERISLSEARGCFSQLADAVAALADKRLVHRDIKPANVLLRKPDRSPVLIDFGLAIDLTEISPSDSELSGTPFFMPPEAWRDGQPTPAWDAYALGVTAAIALAGPPAMPTDLPSLRQAKISGVFERRICQTVGEHRTWIERLIAPDPAERLAAVEAARGWAN